MLHLSLCLILLFYLTTIAIVVTCFATARTATPFAVENMVCNYLCCNMICNITAGSP